MTIDTLRQRVRMARDNEHRIRFLPEGDDLPLLFRISEKTRTRFTPKTPGYFDSYQEDAISFWDNEVVAKKGELEKSETVIQRAPHTCQSKLLEDNFNRGFTDDTQPPCWGCQLEKDEKLGKAKFKVMATVEIVKDEAAIKS